MKLGDKVRMKGGGQVGTITSVSDKLPDEVFVEWKQGRGRVRLWINKDRLVVVTN